MIWGASRSSHFKLLFSLQGRQCHLKRNSLFSEPLQYTGWELQGIDIDEEEEDFEADQDQEEEDGEEEAEEEEEDPNRYRYFA